MNSHLQNDLNQLQGDFEGIMSGGESTAEKAKSCAEIAMNMVLQREEFLIKKIGQQIGTGLIRAAVNVERDRILDDQHTMNQING